MNKEEAFQDYMCSTIGIEPNEKTAFYRGWESALSSSVPKWKESKEFKNAWDQLNFGPNTTPERVVGLNLLKVGLGYYIGSGATFLLEELGFIKDGEITRKGEEELATPYGTLTNPPP